MQTTTRESLIRVKPFVKNVEVHEDNLEGIVLLAAMEAAIYAHAVHGVNSVPDILGVMQLVAGELQPNMVIFAAKLTGNGGETVIESAIDGILSNHQYQVPALGEGLKYIENFAEMRKLAASLDKSGLPPGGPFARALRVHQSLIGNGEISVFKDMYEQGARCLLADPVKEYLNSRGMIHHFEHYFV